MLFVRSLSYLLFLALSFSLLLWFIPTESLNTAIFIQNPDANISIGQCLFSNIRTVAVELAAPSSIAAVLLNDSSNIICGNHSKRSRYTLHSGYIRIHTATRTETTWNYVQKYCNTFILTVRGTIKWMVRVNLVRFWCHVDSAFIFHSCEEKNYQIFVSSIIVSQ